jgi:hypothetical protein
MSYINKKTAVAVLNKKVTVAAFLLFFGEAEVQGKGDCSNQ